MGLLLCMDPNRESPENIHFMRISQELWEKHFEQVVFRKICSSAPNYPKITLAIKVKSSMLTVSSIRPQIVLHSLYTINQMIEAFPLPIWYNGFNFCFINIDLKLKAPPVVFGGPKTYQSITRVNLQEKFHWNISQQFLENYF